MKRILIALTVLVLVVSAIGAQNIGDNFAGGGTVLSGGGNFYTSLNGYWDLSLNPDVGFLISDGLRVGVGLDFYVDSEEFTRIGLGPNVYYTLGYDPDATSGVAHVLGLSSYFSWRSAAGTTNTALSLTPSYRFVNFFTPTIAAYARLTALTVNLLGGFDVSTYINLGFGLSFYVPNEDAIVSNLGT